MPIRGRFERITAKNLSPLTHDPFSTSILNYEEKFFGLEKRYVIDSLGLGVL